jgi:hypothetical protein
MVHGLQENGHDFPDSPVTVETLQEALARFTMAKETAASAEGAAAEAPAGASLGSGRNRARVKKPEPSCPRFITGSPKDSTRPT